MATDRDSRNPTVRFEHLVLVLSCTDALAEYSVLRMARLQVLAVCASIQTCSEHAFVEGLSSILAPCYRVSPTSSPHCLAITCDCKDEIEKSEGIAIHVFVVP
jgi:hypothetical protein